MSENSTSQLCTFKGSLRVYRKGGSFAIFRGGPADGYKPVRRTIQTTTTINGVEHHATVRPNGWTVGDRVDGARFAAPAPTSVQTRSDISVMAGAVVRGVEDGINGILKGVGNAPSDALNGVTSCIFNCGVQGGYFQGANPLAIPQFFSYNGNAREASYGSASSTGFLLGLGVAGGTIFGGSSTLSVVPETTVNNTVTVGRWMSQGEYAAMQQTGTVQPGAGGTTYVAFPANPNSYIGPARPGSVYAEFGVPRSSLQPAGRPDWAQIPGPNSLFGRNEIRFGRPAPQMPPATNPCVIMCRTNVP